MDGRWQSGMCVVVVVAAILAFMATPAVAAVTVDGAISPANEWDNPLVEVIDTVDAPGTAPPGYNLTEVKATIEGNTLYCLMLVDGVAGDADGNGDPDTGTPEYPGVGGGTATFGYEEYNFYIDADNDGTYDYWLRYTWDQTMLTAPGSSVALAATTAGAFGGNVVEVRLANADTWIDVTNFCVAGAADTDWTGAEDYSDKICYKKPLDFDFDFTGIGCYLVEFNGSYTGGATIASHTWEYGDGGTEGPNPGPPGTVSHRYETCGKKTVKLSGYDTSGKYAEVVKQIDVQCGPTAIASANPNCIPGDECIVVTFDGTQSHSNSAYNIIYMNWNFSDGTSTMGKVVTKTVCDPITATLTVMDEQMCEDTAVVRVGPCQEVPLITPLGLIALLGALGAVLLVGVRRKVR